MLFSIFSGIYDRLLGFRCVLHRFYYCIVQSANRNLAFTYDRNIIVSPF